MNELDWLIIEDDEVFARLLKRGLERKGYSVACAASGEQALALLAQQPCRYATLDLNLDGESGLQLLPLLLQQQADLHILVLTGYASLATCVDAIKLGAKHYLPKPAQVEDILLALNASPNPHQPLQEQPMSPARLEWEHIQQVLSANDGNISATARALGMHRRTLQRKLQKRPVQR
ncbi:response regulator transcription factor [Balneatrix alpica]|uniref:Response regulator transcription factor n=1 Tax=Balneatrix alpica TaxID=75684 RepID=A0ABV5ZC25_9GAMM|nr:response regulator [Balneatrix alpica]